MARGKFLLRDLEIMELPWVHLQAAKDKNAADFYKNLANCIRPIANMTRFGLWSSASEAASISGTKHHLSPSCFSHFGRVRAASGIPVFWHAKIALWLICVANGCVASTRWVIPSEIM